MAEKWAMIMSVMVVVTAVTSVLVLNQNDQPSSSPVTVRTDKQVYNLGEVVKYTIANDGTSPARFSHTGYDFSIRTLSGEGITSSGGGSAITYIPPGKEVNGFWSQTGYREQLVSPGTYVAKAGVYESEPFTIIHDESAHPEVIFEEGRHLLIATDKDEYQVGEPIIYSIINTGTEKIRYDNIPFFVYVKNHLGEVVYEHPNRNLSGSGYFIGPHERWDFTWHQGIIGDPDGRNKCNWASCFDVAPKGPYLENIADLNGQQVPTGTYVIVACGWWESPPFTIK